MEGKVVRAEKAERAEQAVEGEEVRVKAEGDQFPQVYQ